MWLTTDITRCYYCDADTEALTYTSAGQGACSQCYCAACELGHYLPIAKLDCQDAHLALDVTGNVS